MNTVILTKLGLSENEIKIYLYLLKTGSKTAYEISKDTNIYRVHVYDKLEQLMNKGLVSHVLRGSKKFFQAAPPTNIKQYLDDKKRQLEKQEKEVEALLPDLEAMALLPREDTFVEVFKGPEGLKYFLKDIVKVGKEVLISDIDDRKYQEALPVFMPQYFRDLRKYKIKERIITCRKDDVFLFHKEMAPTTTYRFLDEDQFNFTNTAVYGDRVVIVAWGTPITAVMIKNDRIARTYRNHFEHLWRIAEK